ncbi:MAG: hypothetical protein GX144_00415 [Clostridiaceae bacterium]|jgi:hypothetical protein|nr:hypothetical protein [Clostridiaceae bacterium]
MSGYLPFDAFHVDKTQDKSGVNTVYFSICYFAIGSYVCLMDKPFLIVLSTFLYYLGTVIYCLLGTIYL